MRTGVVWEVLERLGVRARSVVCLRDLAVGENGNWLVEAVDGERVVLRRYHAGAGREDLRYEHAVLRHVARAGWVVPEPVGPLVRHGDRWWCLNRFVPGQARGEETPAEQRQRGRDLARLEVALRGLGERLGQRPGWQAQHTAVTVHTGIDWDEEVEEFAKTHPRLAAWASRAAVETRSASELPVTVVHGDFASWNVHYVGDQLAGVVDFGLTHLDSRPYELAIARTYRAPGVIQGFQEELSRLGWPLSDLEVAAIEPLHRAFRVDMVAWQLHQGRQNGSYDTAMIERQLTKSGIPVP
ncbi:MAG TPA: phosphotransferase [Acidimicrobiales bacterium]